MKNSKEIDDLLPEVAAKCREFLALCKKEGLDVRITSTLRDFEYQNYLYAQGRTRPGKVVTKAKAGYSWHNYGIAFDFCIFTNGKPDWNNLKAFNRAADIGESIGLESLRHSSFPEIAHLQLSHGKSLAQLRAAHK